MKMRDRRHKVRRATRSYSPGCSSAWKAVVAATTGRKHVLAGHHCEDVVGRVRRQGVQMIALADGAGSAPLALAGATTAVNAVLRYLPTHFRKLVKLPESVCQRRIVDHVDASFQAVADAAQVSVGDLACTLLFAACDGNTLLLGQIGDGRVAVRNAQSQAWACALAPSRGEFANQTAFVTSSDFATKFTLVRLLAQDVDACILMSDGAEASLFNRAAQEYAQAVSTMANWVINAPEAAVEPAIKAELDRLLTVKTMDDVSVALMARSG